MAQRKISELPVNSSPTGTEELVVNDGGVSKKVTIATAVGAIDPKAHNHAGVYEPADATIVKDADIGSTVQAYDATIVVDADIGTTVQAYDATILKDADIGVNVQAYDATIVVDADIGTTVQAYDATIDLDADIGTTVHAYDATIVVDADIGTTVQAYDADTAKTDTAQSFTEDQTFEAITETVTAKSASFTPDLSNDGTVYNVTGAVAVTMPTAESGKSFTIIASAPPSSWTGTIKWPSATVPAGTGICIYTFISDGTNWYGFEAGNAFG